MLEFTTGNLLESDTEAVVNTVNTVGVMGKGIALMFKERYPQINAAYVEACKAKQLKAGEMFVTPTNELTGPKWVINFPTKKHWRHPSKLEWIEDGLTDLARVISEHDIGSIALPPLGCGNGGLDWAQVKSLIERFAENLPETKVIAFSPTEKYQNVAKRKGVEDLTIPRALITEAIRRYWVLGIDCTLLEIQKIAWFLERAIQNQHLEDVFHLSFKANRYGPYSQRLNHLLNSLDGSFLHSDKRIADCAPGDTIGFNYEKNSRLQTYLKSSEAAPFANVTKETDQLIDGFQSPLGLELLATVDWLTRRGTYEFTVQSIKEGIKNWPAGETAAKRKLGLFDDRLLGLACERLRAHPVSVLA